MDFIFTLLFIIVLIVGVGFIAGVIILAVYWWKLEGKPEKEYYNKNNPQLDRDLAVMAAESRRRQQLLYQQQNLHQQDTAAEHHRIAMQMANDAHDQAVLNNIIANQAMNSSMDHSNMFW